MKNPAPTDAISRHDKMVSDPLRTPVLFQAIEKLVKPGDVVLDLGCGLGILTLKALKQGARHVFCCDVDPKALFECKQRVKKAGFEKKVIFFNELSSDIELPEPVDVILSETIGSLGLDENILPFFNDARDRFLKKGGRLLPQKIKIYFAPITLSPSQKPREGYFAQTIHPNQLLSKPQCFLKLDFHKNQYLGFDQEKIFVCENTAKLYGFCGWFEIEWAPNIKSTTAPNALETHWQQGFLAHRNPVKVSQGKQILLRVQMGPKEQVYATESDIRWGFEILN